MPPTIAPVFEDEDEEVDSEEADGPEEDEEVLEVLDALVVLKKPWTAGSLNLVLPPLH